MRAVTRFSLPLLAKELTEQSARGRTFVVRAVYGALLYGITLWGFYRQIGWNNESLAMLGTGHILFEQVLSFQMFAIFALLPMLTAGVLTSEKERDTLGILLITRLGPWTIVLEKFLSRVIPMLLYLLMSLPLMGVAYSLGGVESGSVLWAATLLITSVLQVGSAAVFASAYCRTTTQALLLTYVLVVVYGAAASLIVMPSFNLPRGAQQPVLRVWEVCLTGLLPTLLWLLLARSVLWRRAFLQPKHLGLRLLRWLDGLFHRLNQNRVTKGIVLLDERVELPAFRPIAWRETMKRSLGTVRYLVRFLLLVEGPVLFVLLLPLSDPVIWQSRRYWPLDFAAVAVWWVTVFAVLSQATALIAGERSRQSLDVLLATPLSAERIVLEKFAGVQRLITVLWVPLFTVLLFRGWWDVSIAGPWNQVNAPVYFLQAALAAIIYPPLLGWLGFHAGLHFKSQVTAMTAALAVALVVAGLPWTFDWLGAFRVDDLGGIGPALTTILFPPMGLEVAQPRQVMRGRFELAPTDYQPIWIMLHFALYGFLWFWLRRRAPRDFVRLTGRCEQWEAAGPVAIHHLRDRRVPVTE